MSKEIGTLVVVVLKARNLRDKHTIHKQDVYAQATLDKTTKKTKVDVRGGQHPVWDEELRFPIFKSVSDETRKLEVACYSKEPRSDDLVGRGEVDISETLKTGEFDGEHPPPVLREHPCLAQRGSTRLGTTPDGGRAAPRRHLPRDDLILCRASATAPSVEMGAQRSPEASRLCVYVPCLFATSYPCTHRIQRSQPGGAQARPPSPSRRSRPPGGDTRHPPPRRRCARAHESKGRRRPSAPRAPRAHACTVLPTARPVPACANPSITPQSVAPTRIRPALPAARRRRPPSPRSFPTRTCTHTSTSTCTRPGTSPGSSSSYTRTADTRPRHPGVQPSPAPADLLRQRGLPPSASTPLPPIPRTRPRPRRPLSLRARPTRFRTPRLTRAPDTHISRAILPARRACCRAAIS